MKSTNAEIKLQQRRNCSKDGTESSTKSSSLSRPCSSSSTTDSLYLDDYTCDNCDGEGCTDCDYGFHLAYWPKMKKRARDAKLPKPLFVLFPDEKDARPPNINKTSEKIMTNSENELLKNYCPYSSDNCGCSSGCTDCDYGLYTYTTKNKSKLKSKAKRVYVRSSNGFGSLKASERTAISLSTRNVSRKKKTKFSKTGKTLKNYYPESFGSCDRKSGYIKHDLKLHITRNRILKTKKTRNSGKLKTTRTVRTLKLLNSKKVLNKAAATVSERDVAKNWFSDSFHNCECNSDCTNCKKHVITKRKKSKNRSKRARTSEKVYPKISVKNKVSKQTARICPKRRTSWSSCDSESESYFTGEDC